MRRLAIPLALSVLIATPAFAQHEGHAVSPQPQQPQPSAPAGRQAPSGDDHAGHAVHEQPEQAGEAVMIPPLESGNAPPPLPPADYAADAFFPKESMDRARRILDAEHGGAVVSKFMLDQLEYVGGGGAGGYRWDGEAWFGGDVDRLVLKSKGKGERNLESAEVQALYSRATGPYTDLQIGVRQDIEPGPSRTYLAVGFESLLPYWFDVEGGLFVGGAGQVLGRFKGSLDFLLTQRLVLQPEIGFNLAAKRDADIGLGAGLTDVEVGLRLRYEFKREFAPYIGVVWDRKFGGAADYARTAGDDTETTRFVAGLRAWF